MDAREVRDCIRIILGPHLMEGRAFKPGRTRKQCESIDIRFLRRQEVQNTLKLAMTRNPKDRKEIEGQIAFCTESIEALLLLEAEENAEKLAA